MEASCLEMEWLQQLSQEHLHDPTRPSALRRRMIEGSSSSVWIIVAMRHTMFDMVRPKTANGRGT
jgi:hypothetical protein